MFDSIYTFLFYVEYVVGSFITFQYPPHRQAVFQSGGQVVVVDNIKFGANDEGYYFSSKLVSHSMVRVLVVVEGVGCS